MTRLAPVLIALSFLLTACCCPNEETGERADSETSASSAPEPDAAAEALVKDKRAFVNKHLKRLKKSDICEKGGEHRLRAICAPARKFGKAKLSAPPLDETWVGYTLFIKSDGAVASFAEENAHVSLLAFNKRGDTYRGKVSGVQQKTAKDKAYNKKLVGKVAKAFRKGAKTTLPLEPKLFGYARSLPSKANLDALPHKRGFFLERPEGQGAFGDIRKVGDVWIAIEAPRNPKGVYVSVFKAFPIKRGPAL